MTEHSCDLCKGKLSTDECFSRFERTMRVPFKGETWTQSLERKQRESNDTEN